MGKALKKIGFFVVTLIITAGIYWLVFLDKESKGDVLEYSLSLLGDKLMAMVPEGADKGSVKKLYENFVKQATAKEVAPEQVELVAASILNLSNLDTTLSPEQVEAVLKFSIEAPVKIERACDSKISKNESKAAPEVVITQNTEQKMSQEEWENLGERINSLYKFNDDLQKTMKEHAKELQEQHLQVHYRVDKGLRITMDPQLKQKLQNKKFRHLSMETKKMEQQYLLEWRKDYKKEMEQMRKELDSLKINVRIEQLEKLNELEELQSLKSLEALKALEVLQYIPAINVDSIRIIVKRSLQEAGIYEDGKN